MSGVNYIHQKKDICSQTDLGEVTPKGHNAKRQKIQLSRVDHVAKHCLPYN